jgi:hypothetical protein
MANDTQDALQRAIDYLGAVCVRPGIKETIIGGDGRGADRTRVVREALYARRECASVPYEIIPGAILREYTPERIATFGHRDRQFCGIVTMPAWWSPEQRFKWRSLSGGTVIADALIGEEAKAYCERITADLETGEEVSA